MITSVQYIEINSNFKEQHTSPDVPKKEIHRWPPLFPPMPAGPGFERPSL